MGDAFILSAVLRHTEEVSRRAKETVGMAGTGQAAKAATPIQSVPPVRMGAGSIPAVSAHVAKTARPIESGTGFLTPAVVRHLKG